MSNNCKLYESFFTAPDIAKKASIRPVAGAFQATVTKRTKAYINDLFLRLRRQSFPQFDSGNFHTSTCRVA